MLRDGKHVATQPVSEVTDEDVIGLIVGKAHGHSFPVKPPRSTLSATPVLAVKNLATDKRLGNVSFALRRGEILGIAGLQGMGQLELFRPCSA